MFLATEAGVRQETTILLIIQCLSKVSTVPTTLHRLFNLVAPVTFPAATSQDLVSDLVHLDRRQEVATFQDLVSDLVNLDRRQEVATFLVSTRASTFLRQVTDLARQDRRQEVASLFQDKLLGPEETIRSAGYLHQRSRQTAPQVQLSNNGCGRWQLGQD